MPIFHNQLGTLPTATERVFRTVIGPQQGVKSSSLHENVLVSGAVIPEHLHAVEEILVCLTGTAECAFNGGPPERYQAGSVVVVPAHTPHTIRNTGAGLLRQLSFFSGDPPQTTWLQDPGSVDQVAK